jgi:hypothetical protein
VIGFPLLAAFLAAVGWLSTGRVHPMLLWLGLGGAALGAVLWLLPQIARPVYVVWYFLACCSGIVVSNTLLAAFYYLVLTPTGLIMRLLGRDPMARRFDPRLPSYWVETEKPIAPERYFRQF